ncbi:helix-turn-helix domain-containing protein [Streptomyces scabiei]|uniref:helix-turn-helix domain-containing protein n=1 Tax=Streptomyces scabiei TaxID=1930 RepID=UPI000E676FA7|nr:MULTISPECIES: helix-turn-helix domain-containing protein [Streptomyces]MBP5877065.1 helix-turn-helix domain-containing protein [Streptomyces sp. LBUM 1477]MBP5884851.1 helix-turn-helix domain-containing protein [Streptomyces sp. LBUM 1487]MDW8474329.1 helix-turn-helix domain-containing protein [Streptomyces scabiei]MDX3158984.1 helix-turn-helix domain-containing protein [Streptomyces scabiei]MDX3163254.1 helix-turn-helix domain-containing protein [Streptomyces scabiei]
MDTQNPSVHPHAQARPTGKNNPRRSTRTGGVIHDNSRHSTRFTVVGNHLAQHPELSALAIGLAVHIQSLPTGARVDIRTLAGRFPESPARIAAGLRELETHGYLRRTRERTEGGRIVTRTVSCNHPGRHGDAPADAPEHAAGAPARRAAEQRKKPPRRALPAVPQPGYNSPALFRTATDVLAGLRREDPRLLLSAADAEHLAPGVAAWLERDLTPTAVRDALTSDLPAEPLYRPAALLAHRLSDRLPPLPPWRAPAAAEPAPTPVQYKVRNCDGCDRGFRSPGPGARCRDCRERPAGDSGLAHGHLEVAR